MRKQLGFVDGVDSRLRFEFNDDAGIDHEVRSKAAFKVNIVVHDRNRLLFDDLISAFSKLVCQALPVR